MAKQPKKQAKIDYRWIRAWGSLLHSQQCYIDEQVERARADGAPQNAIYRTDAGRWETTASILHPTLRAVLHLDEE